MDNSEKIKEAETLINKAVELLQEVKSTDNNSLSDYTKIKNHTMLYRLEHSYSDHTTIVDNVMFDHPDDNTMDNFAYYHSYEYALQALKFKKFNDLLLAYKWCYDRYYTPKWLDSKENKFYVAYNYETGTFVSVLAQQTSIYSVCFRSREIADNCAKWLNDHKLSLDNFLNEEYFYE